jgi:hypothetical protein
MKRPNAKPEPNAFQRLIEAIMAADALRIEDAATRVVRDRIRTTKRKAKHCPR